MAVVTYLSIITLNVNGLNLPIKDIEWLNGFKKMIHIYTTYKILTSDLKTFTD